MSYTDKKITQAEINAHHVQGATDYLIGSAQQNKAVFDDLPEFIAGKHNELIDELNSHHGDEIKVAVDEWLAEHPEVTTTVQDNSLTTAKYKDGSVTEPKIANGAVTPSKLDRTYSTPADLASVNANLTNELNVLDARMDTFASLPDGSTSGNAEILDIRVGANGTTYPSAGDAVRGQLTDLETDFIDYTDGFYLVLPPERIRKFSFTPENGNFGVASNRGSYVQGFSLRGAKGVGVEITSGYQYNVFFAFVDGSYSYISSLGSYVSKSMNYINIPEGANRGYITCRKNDDSDFTDEELLGVFRVRLIGTSDKEVVDYNGNTDFRSCAYGYYQYVDAWPGRDWARLTQERYYRIGEDLLLNINPKSGYWAVVNFFDSQFKRLGNNGSWIKSKATIALKDHYSNAAYFVITYRKASGENLTNDDCNQFSVLNFYIKQYAPATNKSNLKFANHWSVGASDIAIYGDTLVIADTNHLIINGVDVTTDNNTFDVGHGNNVMFGTTLYNDFPKLYAGGWYTWNKCVFVNAITENTATLLETITFDDLPTGYVNACVDEPNERIYIFEETGEDTHQGDILFAVGDFQGNILSSKMLGLSLPIIQGMDFKDGFCYVTSGDGSTQYPNYLSVFNTNGDLVSRSILELDGEIEGIQVGETTYIKSLKSLFTI